MFVKLLKRSRLWVATSLSCLLVCPLLSLAGGWSNYSKTCDYSRGYYHCHSHYQRDSYHHHGYYHHHHGGSDAAGAAVAGLLVGGVIGAMANAHPTPSYTPAPVCYDKRVMVSRKKFWRHGKEYEKTGWVSKRFCH